jgi:hypothetical protein
MLKREIDTIDKERLNCLRQSQSLLLWPYDKVSLGNGVSVSLENEEVSHSNWFQTRVRGVCIGL